MVNKVILIGNVGQDLEMRFTAAGTAVTNIRLATHENWKDKKGVKQESTEWHRIVVYGSLAELANKFLVKGNLAYIEGKIQTRKWEDRDGNPRYTTEIMAKEVKFLTPKGFKNVEGKPPTDEAPPAAEPMGDDVPF